MTTPYQGPGLWRQGDTLAALDFLRGLNAQQQEALLRAVNHKPVLTRLMETAQRVQQTAVETTHRLSERAQALATQTRQYGRDAIAQTRQFGTEVRDGAVQLGRDTAAWAGQVRDDTVQRGRDAAAQARQLGTEVRDGAVQFGRDTVARADLAAQRTGEAIRGAGRGIAAGATAAGQVAAGVASMGAQAVVGAGRQAVGAARETADNVSRWYQGQRSYATERAQSAMRAYQQFRNDRNLVGLDPGQRDLQTLTAHAHQLVAAAAQGPEAQAAAAQRLAAVATAMQAGGQNLGGADRDLVNKFAGEGLAPAGNIAAPHGSQGGATQQQNTHGEAQRTGAQQTQKGPDLGK